MEPTRQIHRRDSGFSPANFRADLERLWADGYYPVNLRDLAAGDLRIVPASKHPVVLTFDDSSIEQFRLLPNGKVDPTSAVGILLDFHAAHPADWPRRATFSPLIAGLPNKKRGKRIMFSQTQFQTLFVYHWHITRRLLECAAKLSEADYQANSGYGYCLQRGQIREIFRQQRGQLLAGFQAAPPALIGAQQVKE